MNQQNDLSERLRAALDAVMNHQLTGDRAPQPLACFVAGET
jgi:hypothetical protein